MSMRDLLKSVAAVLLIGASACSSSNALAQTARPSSVLPTGGGQALLVWGNDTAAYFVGRSLGRHKLLPAVSPGKTWEGLLGGTVGGIAALLAVQGLLPQGLGVRDCLVLGLLTAIFGPLGDLSKSMLKRTYQVKDSGHLLPGHGGMLDRIDAVLFNAPVVLGYRVLFGH